ncbi:hypothetical protein AvCA_31640 [Azotobacter vinelandii CA]|uniref:Uncharacterized protein n=2 Tax=Azotobacter vinelandii TaxID=354 RepID=C1DNX4_AZOVD|nr:hypothetical protein Avin_31640 [Azotobacter vinelandii DJ]AGK14719.1 hypothetical protein AvCA_31640 [Azotobacter vinelandii CA]AGK21127.1 hypothetical protein AvCA6_31640 [Azotobacter vinelandii CA6]
MIDSDQIATDPALKLVGVLAKVMQQTGNPRQLLATENTGLFGSQMAHRLQMFG